MENEIKVCKSVIEYNSLLHKAREPNSIVISGMYNSYVDRILIANGENNGKNIEMWVLNHPGL